MNSRISSRIFNKIVLPSILSKRLKGYKIVKRPDPSTLKMPSPASAPSIIDILKEKMRLNGPMTVAEYMHIVVTNPTEGYYMKKEVIGADGDFITSPEISQLFGEILAIWFLNESLKMSVSKPLQIVELGPGKGSILTDFLKVLNHSGYKANDVSLHLVEISETMQHIQANRLCATHRACDLDTPHNYTGETVSGIKVFWYNDLKKVPRGFSWFIAHEFFDVLPIHKFQKTEDGWREILVEVNDKNELDYRISSKETPAVKMCIRPPLDTGERTELEVSVRGLSLARQLAERVDQDGGIAMIADYGHEGEKGDTFRAFHKHKVVDPLKTPGVSDLTADVDFSQLRAAASKSPLNENHAIVLGPVTQKEFLERCHATIRLQVLLENAKSDNEKEKLKTAYNMLVDPDKMGERFKLMAYYPSAVANVISQFPPLGFSTPKRPKE